MVRMPCYVSACVGFAILDPSPRRLDAHCGAGGFGRLTDVVIACIFLALSLPLVIVVALAIKLESSGPILDKQSCIGRGGRRFLILKFRTAVHDPYHAIPSWAQAPTRIGQLIWWTRVEALPQLINVLRGEMSIIDREGGSQSSSTGPRSPLSTQRRCASEDRTMTTRVAASGVLRASKRDEHHVIGYVKRGVDLTVTCALLVCTLPLMIMVALAIKFDSAGPVFYRQERVGLLGRRFALLKFRSMRQDAEADGRPVWAAADDDRITRIGRFIRCTRIDELPQLFNVLRGEMSIAGPRPERPYFVDQLSAIIPSYHDRHTVLPGITGWAQINYPYGASIEDARQKLRYDLDYIANHSLLLDLKILVATVGVVIGRKGAR
jgi:lipopolysaccharide/colanic/teichoic acid biosynthesis glycosyltransferase